MADGEKEMGPDVHHEMGGHEKYVIFRTEQRGS